MNGDGRRTIADATAPTLPRAGAGARAGARRQGRLVAAGGLLGALASMSCCVLPLALFGLGISGAWIANLTALSPYQPAFVAVTLGMLGYGFHLVYRRPKALCGEEGATCASRTLSSRGVRLALWIATALVGATLAFPYVAPRLLGA